MSPLRRRMVDDMQIRNLSPQTQGTYVRQVAQFSRHFGKSPEHLGPAEIRAWQIHLAQDKGLAARSITVAVSALRFFYTSPSNGRVSSPTISPPDGRLESFLSC